MPKSANLFILGDEQATLTFCGTLWPQHCSGLTEPQVAPNNDTTNRRFKCSRSFPYFNIRNNLFTLSHTQETVSYNAKLRPIEWHINGEFYYIPDTSITLTGEETHAEDFTLVVCLNPDSHDKKFNNYVMKIQKEREGRPINIVFVIVANDSKVLGLRDSSNDFINRRLPVYFDQKKEPNKALERIFIAGLRKEGYHKLMDLQSQLYGMPESTETSLSGTFERLLKTSYDKPFSFSQEDLNDILSKCESWRRRIQAKQYYYGFIALNVLCSFIAFVAAFTLFGAVLAYKIMSQNKKTYGSSFAFFPNSDADETRKNIYNYSEKCKTVQEYIENSCKTLYVG